MFTNDLEQITEKYQLMKIKSGAKSLLIVMEAHNQLDRGVYRCEGSNMYGMSEAKFYLRVRYKYGWIYPFGITIAELIVVALLISILGKKSRFPMTSSAAVK